MTQEQMMQAMIDSIGNNSDFVGGLFFGGLIVIAYFVTIGLLGGTFDLLIFWIRKKIKAKYDKK